MNKKTLGKVFRNWWIHGQSAFNYENMQGLGYTYSVLPALREIYKDDDDGLEKALLNQLKFFNCGFYTTPIIMGSTLAIEEEQKEASHDVITSIKTGLMGPLAGIHDTLFQVVVNTIFGALAAYMALEGSYVGVILYVAAKVIELFISSKFIYMAYDQGTKLVKSIGEQLNKITASANIMGMTVIGALIPSVVKASIALVFTQGEVTLEIQPVLDSFIPGLVPLLVVLAVYKVLSMEKMTIVKTTLLIIVAGVLLSLIGVL